MNPTSYMVFVKYQLVSNTEHVFREDFGLIAHKESAERLASLLHEMIESLTNTPSLHVTDVVFDIEPFDVETPFDTVFAVITNAMGWVRKQYGNV